MEQLRTPPYSQQQHQRNVNNVVFTVRILHVVVHLSFAQNVHPIL